MDDRMNGAGIKNAGAATSRLLVEDVEKTRTSLAATATMIIEIIIITVLAVSPASLAGTLDVGLHRLHGFIGHERDEFLEFALVEPYATRSRADVQLNTVTADLAHCDAINRRCQKWHDDLLGLAAEWEALARPPDATR